MKMYKAPHPAMFQMSSNNEFDLYFARAALEELETGADRRGSLPVAPPNQLIIRTEPPRRVHSCKLPSRARRRAGSVSPRPKDRSSEKPEDVHVQEETHVQDHDDESQLITDSQISVQLEPPVIDHSLLAPGPRLDFKCHSAPHSRASSWRKNRRPSRDHSREPDRRGSDADQRRDSINLEESITSKLQELRLLQADDCCVVRNFSTSSQGLINRGDSFKRKSFSVASDAGSSGSGLCDADRSASAHSLGESTATSSAEAPVYRVVIVGAHGVGKTALVQQFLTSQYMGALETSFDDDSEKTVSVLLDGEETMVDMFDVPQARDFKLYEQVDAYVVVYSITDRASYTYAQSVMSKITANAQQQPAGNPAVILVANKSDLLRSRQVSQQEGMDLCAKKDCKYIELSAVLNHRVDELLVGIVSQIRLHPQRVEKRKRKSEDLDRGDVAGGCIAGPRGLLHKLFKRHQFGVSKSCDNLLVL